MARAQGSLERVPALPFELGNPTTTPRSSPHHRQWSAFPPQQTSGPVETLVHAAFSTGQDRNWMLVGDLSSLATWSQRLP